MSERKKIEDRLRKKEAALVDAAAPKPGNRGPYKKRTAENSN